MRRLCLFLSCVALGATSARSQTIDLRGVVKSSNGALLAGVVVTQTGTGLRDTTDAQGRFQIVRTSTGIGDLPVRGAGSRLDFVTGEGLRFEQSVPGTVVLRVMDLQGRSILTVHTNLGAGTWILPTRDLPTGTYFARVEAHGSSWIARFTTVRSSSGIRSPVAQVSVAFRTSAAAMDSLRAEKVGYTTRSIALSSLVDSTLSLVLSPSTASNGSEGCGKAATRPDPASKQTLSVSGANRTYLLFLPTNYSNTKEYPVVFAFHGGGGNGAAARNDFKLEAAANNGAILVYPDGGWNYGSGTDVAFFDAILKDMKSKYCLDTKRVFVTGFSLGGIFSNGLGCLRGGTTVRGIVPVAGSGPNPNMAPAQADIACPVGTPPSDVPTMVIHGTADANALYKYGQWAAEYWRKWNGASTTTTTPPAPFSGCVDYQGGRVPVRFCTHSGGHVVPSWTGQYVWAFVQSLP